MLLPIAGERFTESLPALIRPVAINLQNSE
jgi:hypothetical protein